MPFLQSNVLDCKNGIVFPILKELNWRPAAASGKVAARRGRALTQSFELE
jgi:hypothetical protein